MRKLKMLIAVFLCVFIFTACTQDDSSRPQVGDVVQQNLTLAERKDIFASYFNHNIPFVTGTLQADGSLLLADGTTFRYSRCREENLGLTHPMTGSLDYSMPAETGEEVIVFYVTGDDNVNYAKTVSPVGLSQKYDRTPSAKGATRFDGYDKAEDFYRRQSAVIRENLDSAENLHVLTLDEAMDAFWVASGLDRTDFLLKTGTHGDAFYKHKSEDHVIMVTVNLQCSQTADTEGRRNIGNVSEYEFIVLQSKGYNYMINVDGTTRPVEMVHGVYK